MIISSGFLRNDYLGDDSQNQYDFDWLIFDEDDLQAVVADPADGAETVLVLGVDYTIDPAGVGDVDGGQITLIDAGQDWINGGNLADDWLLTLLSNKPSDQDFTFRNQGPYFGDTVEETFVKMLIYIRQLEEKMSRVLSLPATTDLSDIDIGPPVPDYFLAWNSAGTSIIAVAGSGANTPVSGEVPSGAIDNVNASFTIANTPVSGTFKLYKNGRRTTEFTRIGTAITMDTAPTFGEDLLCDYEY